MTVTAQLTTRPLRYVDGVADRADVEAAVRIMLDYDIAVIGEHDSGAADLAGAFAAPDLDRAATVLHLHGDEIVGVTWVVRDVGGRETDLDVYAAAGPLARAVMDDGLALGLEAARRHHREAPSGEGWTARAGCWSTDTAYAQAMEAHGFEQVRSFYRMRIDCGSPLIPEEMPALPAGAEIVVSDDEATRRRIHGVAEDSFSAHWNHTPRDYAEWWSHWSSSSTRDPSGWWLLTIDGEDAAVCLLDESRAEVGDGYVAVLGVLERFRGRGLATLLLRRTFVHYRLLGRAGVQLGVDAENSTGAVGVYERVGMSPVRVVRGYALRIA